MSQVFMLRRDENTGGPTPASGAHADVLGEIDMVALALMKLVAAERTGVFDGLGAKFWAARDPIVDTARKLVTLAEQRIAELRDAAPR